MNGIEIFIDESGDFGACDDRCPYYIVTMVFHESCRNIYAQIQEFEYRLSLLGLEGQCLHSSPAIRGEDEYRGVDVALRRKALTLLLSFAHHSHLRYKCFIAPKRSDTTEASLLASLRELIDPFVDANFVRLSSYALITIAYDRGQRQISDLLAETLGSRFDNVRVTKTLPIHSRLLQVADLACTLMRVAHKLKATGVISKSESVFFGGERNFRKFWFKSLRKCEWR